MAIANDEVNKYTPAQKLQKTDKNDVVAAMKKKTANVKSQNMEKMSYIKAETKKLLAERLYDLSGNSEYGTVFDSHNCALDDFLKQTMASNIVDSGKYVAVPYTNRYGGYKAFLQKDVSSRMSGNGSRSNTLHLVKNAASSLNKVSRFAK